MDFDVLGIRITSCVWDGDLVIKGERSYDSPVITFFMDMQYMMYVTQDAEPIRENGIYLYYLRLQGCW